VKSRVVRRGARIVAGVVARVVARLGGWTSRVRPGRLLLRLAAALALTWLSWLAIDLTPARWWVDEARFARPRDAFEVVDRNGAVLRHARASGIDRRWVELREVDPVLALAFVAAEDARFREHEGVDGLALVRAAVSAVRPWGRRSGGSTITQQVVKLVHGRPHGLFSKPLEVLRARALERLLTKDQILEQYLNRVPFGDRIHGVARASEEYFGHPVRDVTVAEAALLAGIPQAPSANEPRRHPERAKRRAAYVLRRMAERGIIDEAERAASVDAAAIRVTARRPDGAPRLVDRALVAWRAGSLDRRGGDLELAVDHPLAEDVDRLLARSVDAFAQRGVTNAAGIVVANATGEVLAYTSAAKRASEGGSLDLLERKRQPGSTLKPFAYELFFERGGSAATVVDDIPLPRTGARGVVFEAKDYDGRERGPVRARVALAASLNLAALDVAARVGQHALVERLRELGFHGVADADRYGGAAVLGGLDVTPADLAAAYVTLARGGTRVPLSLARAAPAPGRRVMNAEAAAVARDVLFDGAARAEAFGDDLMDAAGGARFALKTGTSSGFRDAWAAVFDDDFTVVVWMGDPSGRPLAGVSGFEASAPVAARILAAARARAPAIGLAPAPRTEVELVDLAVCAQTGLRVGPGCRHTTHERFAPGSVPHESCAAHDDSGDLVLPSRYADWVAKHHPSGVARTFGGPSDASDPAVVVREPRDGARLVVDPSRGTTVIPLRARVGDVDAHDADVSWHVDGVAMQGDAWPLAPGEHEVVAEWRGKRSDPARVRVELARARR
jgi:penicillin-binding protein 1C